MFLDGCLAEISKIQTEKGPLVDFSTSINQNIYCEIVDYAMKVCLRLFFFVINMVVRWGDPILPSHVLKCSTLFASICYAANHDLNALVKLSMGVSA